MLEDTSPEFDQEASGDSVTLAQMARGSNLYREMKSGKMFETEATTSRPISNLDEAFERLTSIVTWEEFIGWAESIFKSVYVEKTLSKREFSWRLLEEIKAENPAVLVWAKGFAVSKMVQKVDR
jgi:hypothetical protein